MCSLINWIFTTARRNIYQAARELADNAITAGVKKGTAVGIYMERCLELPITIMAVWLAGGIYAPLDPSFPESRIQIYIEDSKAAFIICKSQHIGDLEDMLEESASLKHRKKQIGLLDIENLLPNLPRPEMSSNSPAAPAGNNHRIEAVNGKLPKVEPDDIAYIIFTSGTTGRPKGVQCHHGGLRDLVNFQVDLCKAGPGEVLLLSTTINFDPHLAHLLTAMCSGAELVIAQPEGHTDPVYMANLVVKNGITVFECVPTLAEVYLPELERVAEEHSRQMPLKMWMMGGEELPFALLKTLQEVSQFSDSILSRALQFSSIIMITKYLFLIMICFRDCLGSASLSMHTALQKQRLVQLQMYSRSRSAKSPSVIRTLTSALISLIQ